MTERNLRQIFSELEFGQEYEHQPTGEAVFGTVLMKLSEVKVIDIKDCGDKTNNQCGRIKCIPLEDTSINFVSLDFVKRKSKYHRLFDVIYVNGAYLKHLDKDFVEKARRGTSLLMVENQRFVLSYREKDLQEHYKNVKEKLEGLLVEEMPFSCEKNDYITFVVKSGQ